MLSPKIRKLIDSFGELSYEEKLKYQEFAICCYRYLYQRCEEAKAAEKIKIKTSFYPSGIIWNEMKEIYQQMAIFAKTTEEMSQIDDNLAIVALEVKRLFPAVNQESKPVKIQPASYGDNMKIMQRIGIVLGNYFRNLHYKPNHSSNVGSHKFINSWAKECKRRASKMHRIKNDQLEDIRSTQSAPPTFAIRIPKQKVVATNSLPDTIVATRL